MYTASSSLPSMRSGSRSLIERTVARPSASRLIIAGDSGGGGPSITMAPVPLSVTGGDGCADTVAPHTHSAKQIIETATRIS